MKLIAKVASENPASQTSQCLVVGMFKGKTGKGKGADKGAGKPKLGASAAAVDKTAGGAIAAIVKRGDLDGAAGTSQMLYGLDAVKAERVLLLGLGAAEKFDRKAAKAAGKSLVRLLNKRGIAAADVCLLEAEYHADKAGKDGDTDAAKGGDASGGGIARRARNLAEGMLDGLYRFDATKSEKKKPRKLKRITMLCKRDELGDVANGLREGEAVGRGVALARDLGNLPGNICTPSYLAAEAKKLGKKCGFKTTVLDEAAMKKLGMGSLLSVSRGSREEAKLIVMEYRGAKKSARPVVLVGKGLTFDAGGISLKPAAAMDEMKYDMCGGASVLAAMQAAAELQLKLNLVGIVPASENLPDGAANKPGDIVTSMRGTTIEILNTDAEGRLILCDALTYAERFKPAAVVDMATLTGACVVALGAHASGLFSNCDALAEELLAAGEAAGDRAWRMPVWEEYTKQLDSNFADLANIGGRNAGAVTAACFLKHFADKYDWAHLDIAGTAWKSGGEKGANGRPVGLLVEFLLGRAGE